MNTVYMTYMQRKNNQNITKKAAVIMTNNIILKYICSFFCSSTSIQHLTNYI